MSLLLYLILRFALTRKADDDQTKAAKSIFNRIGEYKDADRNVCISAHYSLTKAMDPRIKFNQNCNQNAYQIATDYIRSAHSGYINILTLISIQKNYGIESKMAKIYRFWSSETWNIFMSLIVLLHISMAFIESSARAPQADDCDTFAICNLKLREKGGENGLTDLESSRLLQSTVTIVICFNCVSLCFLECPIF